MGATGKPAPEADPTAQVASSPATPEQPADPPAGLPPPPAAPEGDGPFPDTVRLTWHTPFFIALAELVAYSVLWLPFCIAGRTAWGALSWIATCAAWAAALRGLGAAAADRWTPGYPRPIRWALGMAVVSIVPPLELLVPALLWWRTPFASTLGWGWAPTVPWTAGQAIVVGLVLGSVAGRTRGSPWGLALAGLVMFIALYGFSGVSGLVMSLSGVPPWGPRNVVPCAWLIARPGVRGALFGIALALALDRSRGAPSPPGRHGNRPRHPT
jgi:hypothetical protein